MRMPKHINFAPCNMQPLEKINKMTCQITHVWQNTFKMCNQWEKYKEDNISDNTAFSRKHFLLTVTCKL